MLIAVVLISISGVAYAAEELTPAPGEKRLNNLVSVLLEVPSVSQADRRFSFSRPSDGWVLIACDCRGNGRVRVALGNDPRAEIVIVHDGPKDSHQEAMHYLTKGAHTLRVLREWQVSVTNLVVKAIPELIHCGLGYDPAINSYGGYDLDFLKKDILPNINTLIVPSQIKLPESVVADWHRQGKKFIGEVGVNAEAKPAEEHAKFWSRFYDQAPFLDGLVINEFIVNRPVVEWAELTPERLARMDQERKQYELYGEAIRTIHADARYKGKKLYGYVGGSGKKLNQEIIGTNFVRTIIDCGYRIALERYLHEMSSEKGAREALQALVEGIADWEAREPGVKKQMVIAFGLFSMPPGSINKQPNVDYHVWMDQQMNLVANHPKLSGIAGLEWWTSLLADEETVRFVGKLYRHYAIEGKTAMLTSDPLFLRHIQNADFEKGTESWTLQPAAEGSIAPKSFPRYGRIEGRYMGLGRPADPEHIGDTFLWMKRNASAPNTFSQAIKELEPGRLYSLKMLSCDYEDLINPKAKSREQATGFIGSLILERVEIDSKRSLSEMYASSPEPKIPIWITYHWKVFRAKSTTVNLTVSDWPANRTTGPAFGQEQTFNFLELQPYHE